MVEMYEKVKNLKKLKETVKDKVKWLNSVLEFISPKK